MLVQAFGGFNGKRINEFLIHFQSPYVSGRSGPNGNVRGLTIGLVVKERSLVNRLSAHGIPFCKECKFFVKYFRPILRRLERR